MISSHRIPPIVILFIGAFNKYITWERGGSRRTKQQKMTRKVRRAVKIVMPMTQILPCTFFCNSVFTRSLFTWWCYSKQQKEHIQENRPVYLKWLYNICTKISQLHCFVIAGCLYIHICQKIQFCLKMWFSTSFHTKWYAEAAIYEKKSSLPSFYSFLVKFSE